MITVSAFIFETIITAERTFAMPCFVFFKKKGGGECLYALWEKLYG
jgi:hypothetical protein